MTIIRNQPLISFGTNNLGNTLSLNNLGGRGVDVGRRHLLSSKAVHFKKSFPSALGCYNCYSQQ
jgi:hypothetical protein